MRKQALYPEIRKNKIAHGCPINDFLGSFGHFLFSIFSVFGRMELFQEPQVEPLIKPKSGLILLRQQSLSIPSGSSNPLSGFVPIWIAISLPSSCSYFDCLRLLRFYSLSSTRTSIDVFSTAHEDLPLSRRSGTLKASLGSDYVAASPETLAPRNGRRMCRTRSRLRSSVRLRVRA